MSSCATHHLPSPLNVNEPLQREKEAHGLMQDVLDRCVSPSQEGPIPEAEGEASEMIGSRELSGTAPQRLVSATSGSLPSAGQFTMAVCTRCVPNRGAEKLRR